MTPKQLVEQIKEHGSDRLLDCLCCAFDDMIDDAPVKQAAAYRRLAKKISGVKVPHTIIEYEMMQRAVGSWR